MKFKLFMLAVLAIVILPAFIRIAPPTKVSGIVKDEQGNPLEQVNVQEKGVKRSTVTNSNGEYQLKLTTQNPTLVFSSVGYQPQTINVGTNTKINVTLKPSLDAMQEVVVVGYSTRKKNGDYRFHC